MFMTVPSNLKRKACDGGSAVARASSFQRPGGALAPVVPAAAAEIDGSVDMDHAFAPSLGFLRYDLSASYLCSCNVQMSRLSPRSSKLKVLAFIRSYCLSDVWLFLDLRHRSEILLDHHCMLHLAFQ